MPISSRINKRKAAARRHFVMSKMMSSGPGRAKLASSFTGPLRIYRDYLGIGRKLLFVDDLPDGTLPIYDMDPDIPAFVVGEGADNIEVRVNSPRLLIPQFEIASNPTVPFVAVKERRYDVTKRVREKTRNEIVRVEDRVIFNAIEQAATHADNSNTLILTATPTWDDVIDGFAEVENSDLRVDKLAMSPDMFRIFRKAGRDYIDFETQREILRTGLLGVAYGAQIYSSAEIPKGTIYFLAEEEYVGTIPVRMDITVIPADEPKNRVFGWSVFCNEGVGIHNLRGIGALKVSE